MRTIRAMTLAAAVVAVLPTVVSAQKGRGWDDSWFWGIKAGGFTVVDSGQKYVQAPTVGIDWMITRTHGGLYISGSETFFSQHSFVLRDPAFPDSGFRPVSTKNMRRLDVALMGFPGEHLNFHPYVGAGFTMQQAATVQAEGPFFNIDQATFADSVIKERRVGFTPVAIVGGQWRKHLASIFVQATMTPAQTNFVLYNGRPFTFSYEAGLRYNFGSAIDRND